MTKDEALRLALEALGRLIHLAEHEGWERLDKEYESITAIKAALEAKDEPVACCNGYYKQGYEAGFAGQQHYIHALQEALAKQEQDEPVAWYRDEDGIRIYYETKAWDDCIALYTTPPQRTWIGLTKEEFIYFSSCCHFEVVDEIEKLLQRKNT